MRKSLKILLSVILFLLFFPLVHTLISIQDVVRLPFYFLPFTDYPYIGESMAQLLFWVSAFLLILLFVSLLVLLLYPKVSSFIEKKVDSGKITIQKKAIENFVLIAAKEEPFIVDPAVKAVIKKKKIKIYVRGQIRKALQTTEHQTAFIRKINTDLNQLFGAEQIILTEIIFKDYHKTNKETKSKVL
ncbi:alkaline shock response membrane anchor protein AmaP [Enterococcus faecalis]|nr:alkaline shock response membrane anchor protein AmaP [Enterococcus faecalis]